MNTMGFAQSYVTFVGRTTDYRPGTNTADGARVIYGGKNQADLRPDVGVTTYRFDPVLTNSDYSSHSEGKILNPATNSETGSYTTNNNQPGPRLRYFLKRGQTYRIQVTLENLGNISPVSMSIYGWLSTDINITSSDFLVGSWGATSSSNPAFFSDSISIIDPARNQWPWETYLDMTIPTNAPTGESYLGVSVTCTMLYGSACNDFNAWNNSTYYAVNIQP